MPLPFYSIGSCACLGTEDRGQEVLPPPLTSLPFAQPPTCSSRFWAWRTAAWGTRGWRCSPPSPACTALTSGAGAWGGCSVCKRAPCGRVLPPASLTHPTLSSPWASLRCPSISDTGATNLSMAAVGQLPGLERLNLSFTGGRAARLALGESSGGPGLLPLPFLSHHAQAHAPFTWPPAPAAGVDDRGLRQLKRMTSLRCLNLDSRLFTGALTRGSWHTPMPAMSRPVRSRPAACAACRRSTCPYSSCRSSPRCPDAGMVHVARLTSLECLDLFGARISDTGCAAIRCGILSAM